MLAAALVAHSLVVLLLLLALAGVANSIVQPAINLFMADQVPPDRQGLAFGIKQSGIPGAVLLSGLALPVLRRAMRDGSAPNMARWVAAGDHRLVEWETDLSSQTGASQAGILLGSNEDIPAFRWVEKETGTLMTCSAPADCAEIERRRSTGIGLLVDGGAMNNLPVDVMLQLGRGPVIGCDAGADRAFATRGDGVDVPLPWQLMRWIRTRRHLPNIFQILWRTGMVNSNGITAEHRARTDLLLQPPLADIDMLNWKAFDRAIQAGYEYTRRRLDALPEDSPLWKSAGITGG